jgi:hypothetical protein
MKKSRKDTLLSSHFSKKEEEKKTQIRKKGAETKRATVRGATHGS